MIENNTQLAAALHQMESFTDTLEGMRRYALEKEASVFAVSAGGFINLLRERITEMKAYVDSLPDVADKEHSRPGNDGASPLLATAEAARHSTQRVGS